MQSELVGAGEPEIIEVEVLDRGIMGRVARSQVLVLVHIGRIECQEVCAEVPVVLTIDRGICVLVCNPGDAGTVKSSQEARLHPEGADLEIVAAEVMLPGESPVGGDPVYDPGFTVVVDGARAVCAIIRGGVDLAKALSRGPVHGQVFVPGVVPHRILADAGDALRQVLVHHGYGHGPRRRGDIGMAPRELPGRGIVPEVFDPRVIVGVYTPGDRLAEHSSLSRIPEIGVVEREMAGGVIVSELHERTDVRRHLACEEKA